MNEFYYICIFLSGKQKDYDWDLPYNNYFKSKSTLFSVRYTFIQVRMMEHQKRFMDIPRVVLRMTNTDNTISFIQPLPFEKASFYYLIRLITIAFLR